MELLKRRAFPFVFILFAFFASFVGQAQSQMTIPNYTACPNQSVLVQATWNNVSNIVLALFPPPVNSPSINIGSTTSFSLSHPSNVPVLLTYTVVANGQSVSGPVSNTVTFQLQIDPPPAMTLGNVQNYCSGTNAQIVAPIGGASYIVSGPGVGNNYVSTSNIINIPNVVAPSYNGQYLVTTNIAGCTHTGVTTIAVAPNTPLSVNNPSNVCQGENISLQAAMPGGINFEWYDPLNSQLCSSCPTHNLNQAQPGMNGIYTAKADLSFTGPNGQSITCPRTATTQVNVVGTNPVVVNVQPGKSICQGQNINLTANAASASSYSWTGPLTFNSTAQNPVIPAANPQHSGKYRVTAFFVGGFVTCRMQDSININVVPVQVPNVVVPQSACQNATINLSANAGANAVSYSWIGPNFASNNQNPTLQNVQPGSSGIYYVTAFFTDGVVQCSRTASAQLNVVPVNSVSVVPPPPVCEPASANLQANAAGANMFTWLGPNGFSTPGANVTVYNPGQAANGIYSVTAYFGGGNLTCTSTNTVQLVVNPVLHFSLTPFHQVCYEVPLSVIGPGGASSYTWTSSTGFTSNTKDLVFPNIQQTDKGTYTLTVALGPCKSSDYTTIDVMTQIQYTLVPTDRRVCRGDTVHLEAAVTGGSQNYAYTWNPPIYLDQPTGPKRIAVPLGSVVYNIVTHDIACPQFKKTTSFTITVDQPPVVDLHLPEQGCAPLALSLDINDTTNSAQIVTFDFGGGLVTQRDTFDLLAAGAYTLNVYTVGKNGCKGYHTYPYPIVVHPKPETELKWQPEAPTTSDEVRFAPVFKSGAEVKGYVWEFYGGNDLLDTSSVVLPNGLDITTLSNPMRHYPSAGKFPLRLIATTDHGCTDTAQSFISIIDEMRIFIPNTFTPNGDGINDLFKVKGIGLKAEGFSLEITDRWGNIVFFTKNIDEGWDGTIKGTKAKTGSFIYRVKAVGMHGEGRRELTGYVNLIN